MESNLGYLEYELCGFLNKTPRQVGELRKEDPTGVAFLERFMIHKWNKEAEAREKAERQSKTKGKSKVIRRK